MKKEGYIEITTVCVSHNISDAFILALRDFELIEILEEDDTKFIALNQLDVLERFVRLHNELDINPEGIDAIHHLVQRIHAMETEMNLLRQRLRLYESDDFDF